MDGSRVAQSENRAINGPDAPRVAIAIRAADAGQALFGALAASASNKHACQYREGWAIAAGGEASSARALYFHGAAPVQRYAKTGSGGG